MPKGLADFGQEDFPPVPVPGSSYSGTQELYPENIQDRTNKLYVHDKSMPRIKGQDYIDDQIPESSTPETISTFPHKYT